MNIHCCGCDMKVEARLTDGAEIYSHLPGLRKLPFWKCDTCGNYVGCHHRTSNPTNPLGSIPTPEIRNLRKEIHRILDPMWKSGAFNRKEIYKIISEGLGGKHKYHTAQIRSVDEARRVLEIITTLKGENHDQNRSVH